MSINITVYRREHNIKHYVGLSLQTVLIYLVFIGGVFSVPVAKIIAGKVTELEVQKGVIGETVVTLDIADDNRERLKGLSEKVSIPKNHAMLFVFDEYAGHGIWMKDMEFSIDIVWLNEYSEVVHIEKNISPDTFPKVFGQNVNSKYVLEFNSGFVERSNIKIGDKFVIM